MTLINDLDEGIRWSRGTSSSRYYLAMRAYERRVWLEWESCQLPRGTGWSDPCECRSSATAPKETYAMATRRVNC